MGMTKIDGKGWLMVTTNEFQVTASARVVVKFTVSIDPDEAAAWLAENPLGDLIELAREKAEDYAVCDLDLSHADESDVAWEVEEVDSA